MSGAAEENWSKKPIMYYLAFWGFGDETSQFSEINALCHSIWERMVCEVLSTFIFHVTTYLPKKSFSNSQISNCGQIAEYKISILISFCTSWIVPILMKTNFKEWNCSFWNVFERPKFEFLQNLKLEDGPNWHMKRTV